VPETPCVHCGVGIISDGHDAWVHLTRGGYPGLYRCQSPDVEYGHLAHPESVPCPADPPNPCLGSRRG
jgi:hypothetical protein